MRWRIAAAGVLLIVLAAAPRAGLPLAATDRASRLPGYGATRPPHRAATFARPSRPQRSDPDLVRAWRDAVQSHAPGKGDEAVQRLVAFTDAEFDRMRTLLGEWLSDVASRSFGSLARNALANVAGLADPGSASITLRRAAMLHADVALFESRTAPVLATNPNVRNASVVVRDGEVVGYHVRREHFAVARVMLRAVAVIEPEARAFARQFYRATALWMAADLRFDELRPHLRAGLVAFPEDASLWLVAGALHESLATPLYQQSAPVMGPRGDVEAASRELERAHEHLTQAATLEPASAETILHLGRVESLRGEPGLAAEHLLKAEALATEPYLQFYAALFLGRVEQSRGNVDESRDAFRRALQRFPDAQSARLGLSQLAAARGDLTGARAVMGDAFSADGVDVAAADPWWVYNLSHTRNLALETARLHELVPAPLR
jgi:tetratricopeptide (TPR) repeat protein